MGDFVWTTLLGRLYMDQLYHGGYDNQE